MHAADILRARLASPELVIAPGIYDALSAFRAQEAGFEAVFVSGSALAATHLARPDIGLLSLGEMAGIVSRITERITIPAMIDADQAFGNAFMTARTVKLLERAGAAGIQIEDQCEVKPFADPLSRPLIAPQAMADKIKAAKDASSANTVISARTDVTATDSFAAALDRIALYDEAGADMLFVEGLKTRAQMEQLVSAVGGKKPLLHNLLRADDEVTSAEEVATLGYAMVLFPGVVPGAIGAALDKALSTLAGAPALGTQSGSAVDRIGAKAFLAGE